MKRKDFYKIVKKVDIHTANFHSAGETEWDKKVNHAICKTFEECCTWCALAKCLVSYVDELNKYKSSPLITNCTFREDFNKVVETYLPENEPFYNKLDIE